MTIFDERGNIMIEGIPHTYIVLLLGANGEDPSDKGLAWLLAML